MPVPVGELELSSATAPPETNSLGQISVLVRLHGAPLGVLNLLREPTDNKPDLVALAAERLEGPISEHLRRDGLTGIDALARTSSAAAIRCSYGAAEPVDRASVVVCTLGEDHRLRRTVDSILAQSHGDLELIVVDNQPASGKVQRLLASVDDPRLRIVQEPRRGLSVARNTGLAVARSDFVAYTDDDAFADPDWLRYLLAPFAEHPGIVCVTGLVLPAELSTAAQLLFEEFGAFDKGFERVVWTAQPDDELARLGVMGEHGVLFPYSAGVFGSGNNMAFRTQWLRDSGAFDVALGAGTRARGGEDLDAFLQVILAGRAIIYEPHALVRHAGRADLAALRQQMFGYGSGMSAVIAKHFLASPGQGLGIVRRLPAGLRRLVDPASSKNEAKSDDFPAELSRAELRGYAAGPALYLQSRVRARRANLHDPPRL